MERKILQFFEENFPLLTIDDIYQIADDNQCSVFLIYRTLSILTKEQKVSKVHVEYDGVNYKIVDSYNSSNEMAFIPFTDSKVKPLLSQEDIEKILDTCE